MTGITSRDGVSEINKYFQKYCCASKARNASLISRHSVMIKADPKAGGLTLPIQKDPENDGPRWSEARLVPVHDPTDRSMIISVPGRVSDCVQVKGNNGGPEPRTQR